MQLHAGTVLHQRLGTHQEETVHRDHPPAVIGTWFVGLPGGYATVFIYYLIIKLDLFALNSP